MTLHARWFVSLTCLSLITVAGCVPAEESAPAAMTPEHVELTEVWRLDDGFERPESVVLDTVRKVLYVSSIGENRAENDRNGYISRISPDGVFQDTAWVTGLNAPKGLALKGDLLYASVVDEVVAIDVNSGEIVETHSANGAEFLNDVTVDAEGNVYISDSGTGVIYRLREGELGPFVSGGNVASPNGLYAMDEGLIVAAADTTHPEPGGGRYLKRVDYDTKNVVAIRDTTALGALDAVEPDGRGGFFLSDWAGGTISRWTPEDGEVVLEELERGTADLTYVADDEMIYVPLMMSGQLVAYRVEWH